VAPENVDFLAGVEEESAICCRYEASPDDSLREDDPGDVTQLLVALVGRRVVQYGGATASLVVVLGPLGEKREREGELAAA
jgi:hypothetical protein